MKPADSDLIEKLNSLSDRDLTDLLEFLGVASLTKDISDQLLDSLRASLSLRAQEARKSRT